jgi:hypothetical protein
VIASQSDSFFESTYSGFPLTGVEKSIKMPRIMSLVIANAPFRGKNRHTGNSKVQNMSKEDFSALYAATQRALKLQGMDVAARSEAEELTTRLKTLVDEEIIDPDLATNHLKNLIVAIFLNQADKKVESA